MELKPFFTLAKLFEEHGFNLWMIGGTSRDYLLKLPVLDYDLTTDAQPSQMQTFLPDANYRFAHYGTVMVMFDGHKMDITTLRQESLYHDKRHPQSITFVTTPQLDYQRRDLTINALYIDPQLRLQDFTTGQLDLENKLLRMIGDPLIRLKEDPLRILRVLRFHHRFGFSLEPQLAKALVVTMPLLEHLNPNKVKDEIKKMLKQRPEEATLLLASYGIHPQQE
jgi:tRNA nucleotidyltransferase/poly(A) polymerase